jgi:hypothetical protein
MCHVARMGGGIGINFGGKDLKEKAQDWGAYAALIGRS